MSGYTFPLRAQDLRDADAGAVVDVSDGIVGRLVSVTHGPLGTELRLEGVDPVVHVFAGDLIGVDRETWRRLWFDADRRGICREGVAEQDRLELTRKAAVTYTRRFQKAVSDGWDEVGGPDLSVDA